MDRPELGVLLSQLLREVIRREEEILARAGLQMWDYVVLAALTDGDAPTQSQLAARTRRDKTRLIGNLDHLEDRRLVTRSPDPADRRNRVVAMTSSGRAVWQRCHEQITAMEKELLRPLDRADRAAFERALVRLTAVDARTPGKGRL